MGSFSFEEGIKNMKKTLLVLVGLVVASALSHAQAVTPPSGLISWWKGEGDASDSAGTNNGVQIGNVQYAPGKVGKGFLFNGTNSYIRVPDSVSLHMSNALTIELWLQCQSQTGAGVVAKRNVENGPINYEVIVGGLGLTAEFNDPAVVDADHPGNYENSDYPYDFVSGGLFHHVATTFQQVASNSVVVLTYIDGQLVKTRTFVANLARAVGNAPVTIGVDTEYPTYGYFTGIIDEVSLYNRALSSNEIAAIYGAGSLGKSFTPAPPAITSVNPLKAKMGDIVTITGTGFSSLASNNIVYIGGVKAVVTGASTTSLTVIVPAGATYAPITVTVNMLTAYAPVPFLPTYNGSNAINSSSLAPRVSLGTGANSGNPSSTAIGDLNGDGKPDLVEVNANDNRVWIYQNISTNGTLAPASFASAVILSNAVAANAVAVTLADLDGDGRLDVIVADAANNLVSIFQNISAPGAISTSSFAARVDLPAGAGSQYAAVRDLDGDGLPDIVTANYSGNSISIFRNLIAGGVISSNKFAPKVDIVAASPGSIAIGDVDGDGKPDIAVNNQSGSSLSVFRNISSAGNLQASSFAPKVDFALPGSSELVAFGDVDGDGKLDLLIADYLPQKLSVYRNAGVSGTINSNSFSARIDFAAGGRAHRVAMEDIDGDGKPDVLVTTELPNQLLVYRNVSSLGNIFSNSLNAAVVFNAGSNPNALSVADLDGDGRPDVLVANSYDVNISIYRNVTPLGTPPFITSQPLSRTNVVGDVATFSVTATGAAPLSYQWSFKGTNISGGTNAALMLNNVQLTDAGNYQVTVSNIAGTTNSAVAVLTVVAPVCTAPPSGLVSWWRGEGDATDVMGTNNGIFFNGASYAGGKVGQAFKFVGGIDNVANPAVQIPYSPSLVTSNYTVEAWINPSSQVTNSDQQSLIFGEGGSVQMVVQPGTTGVKPMFQFGTGSSFYLVLSSIQIPIGQYSHVAGTWDGVTLKVYVNGVLGGQAVPGAKPASTGCPFFIGGFYSPSAGSCQTISQYFNGLIDELSYYNRALSSNEIAAIYGAGSLGKCYTPIPPFITSQPVSRTNVVGDVAVFGVTATGTVPMSYQWSFKGTNIGGGTNATLTLNNVQLTDAGNYQVTVSNIAGTTNSAVASLTVNQIFPTLPPQFFDDFSGPGLGAIWQPSLPNAYCGTFPFGSAMVATYIGAPNFGFETMGSNSILRLTNTMNTLQRRGWSSTTNFIGTNFYYEVRFNTLKQSSSNSIDGFIEIWVLDATNSSRYDIVSPFGGSYASSPYFFSGSSIDGSYTQGSLTYSNFTWYRMVLQSPPGQNIRASILDDNGKELVGRTFNHSASTFKGGFKIALSQVIGYAGGTYPVDAAVDYVKLSPGTPPVITNQPASQNAYVGDVVTFNVSASGFSPFNYQWSFKGTNIGGGTNATLTLNNVQLTDAGNYQVTVSNIAGTTNSAVASLTVTVPVCTTPPSGLVSWWRGEWDANDSVGTNNGVMIGGIGYTNGKVGVGLNLDHATSYVSVPASPSLNIGTGSGITIECWTKPDSYAATVYGGPIIEWDSANTDGLQLWSGDTLFANIKDSTGVSHTLQAKTGFGTNQFYHVAVTYDKVSGAAVLYINGTNVASANFGNITPQTTYPLNIGRRTGQPVGLNNTYGGIIDELSIYNRALSSNEIAAIYGARGVGKCPLPPNITGQPTNQTVIAGDPVTFDVTAVGFGPFTYQWYFGGNPLANETNRTLKIPEAQLSQAGNYSVVVGNSVGLTPSQGAQLNVIAPVCIAPPAGLVAWWAAEGSTIDSAGTNNGILGAGIGYGGGKVGAGWVFQTNSTGIRVPWSPGLDLGTGNGITIECWVKPVDLLGSPFVEWKSDTSSDLGVHFWVGGFSGPGTLYANFADVNGVNHYLMSAGNAIRSNVWQHVAATYDRNTGLARLYCNGTKISEQVLGTFTPRTTYDLYFGKRPSPGFDTNSLAGGLDEISLYNRALSSNEIAAIYGARGAGKCPLPPTIVNVTPTNWFVNEGTTVSYNVAVVGTPPFAYQWQFNNTDIPGATNATLTLSNVVYSQAGNYDVVVSNPGGMVTSSNVVLQVNRAPIADASATEPLIISPNGTNAISVLDGSHSSDPDGDVLTYAWFYIGNTNVFATGVVVATNLPVGTNQLTLTVGDGMAFGSQDFVVEVITTSQALDRLIALVKSGSGNTQPLVASLRAALAAIDRSQPDTAINQLQAFINKVQAQVQPVDPVLAAQLIADAQAIIDALNGGSPALPAMVEISSFSQIGNGKSHLKIHGNVAGRVYIVETSTNMVDWVPVGVASKNADGDYEFDDTQGQNSGMRFYRIVSPK
jgi:hypothetical protein